MRGQARRVLDIEPIESFEGKLWALSRAAVAINSERSVEQMLQVITEQARAIIGAHLGSTSLTREGAGAEQRWPQQRVAVSLSSHYERYADYERSSQGADWYGLVCEHNQVVRLTAQELRDHPLWRDFGDEGPHHPPLRGWLAAPLVASDGTNIGLLQLSDACAGEFAEADEAILVQLAQLASIAVEKAQLLSVRDQQAVQLRGLADAAVAISSALDVDEMLDRITRVAVDLVPAHQAITRLTSGRAWDQAITSTYLSDRYEDRRSYDVAPDGRGIYARVCERNEVVRLTQQELEAHPEWLGFSDEAADRPPMRGWLAVPLATADGRNLGLIQLSDPVAERFTEHDESLLVQLARLASVAIQNTQLQHELVTRQRQQLTQDLLAGLSHDMQTPLAVILGLATILRSEPTPSADEVRDLAEMLDLQGGRLRALIRQFLDYVRLEAGEPLVLRRGAVELRPLLEDLTELFSGQRELEVHLEDEVVPVRADPDRVLQILSNLVGNAIKFSDSAIVIDVRRRGSEVAIAVTDTGRGIVADELERVFGKLYRGEGAREDDVPGHGLGLYISRALADALGGRLDATSEPEAGSTFTLTLPVHDTTATKAPSNSR